MILKNSALIINTSKEAKVVQSINDEIVQMNHLSESTHVIRERLLELLVRGAYRNGEFTLASGRKSNHYVNCKPIALNGIGLQLISKLFLDQIETESCAVAGLTLGADPLVSGVAMTASQVGRTVDALIVRKEPKGHGTCAWLEGPLPPKGSLVTVLEDVVTTGGSSLKAVNQIREAGYLVNRVVTLVDREEGGSLKMKENRLELRSLFLLKELAEKAIEIK